MLGLTSLALYGSAYADYSERADVQEYVEQVVEEYGFSEAELLALFQVAERKERILESIARPAERTLEWWEYRNIFLKEPRISQGLEFWLANRKTLERAEAEYGVPAQYVVAILGVETRYGRHAGGYRVLDALTTLAFDYPPRSSFFKKELTQYLLLAREEERDPLWFMGSYAGAMGYGQFIPSSFRAYAVDYDGDGRRDIWTSETDAIGSVANYFSRHGWRADSEVARRVELVAGENAPAGSALDKVANESLKLTRTVGELRGLGVRIDGLPAAEQANLYRMALQEGAEYWLGLNNFYVITRYNHSRLYALAVHQLSEEIAARMALEPGAVARR